MKDIAARIFVVLALAAAALFPAACSAQTDPNSGQRLDTGEHWSWGTTDEIVERNAVIGAVKTAFFKEDYAGLDALEVEYRGSKGAFPSGGSKLALYYQQLIYEIAQSGSQTSDKCAIGGKALLDKWQAVSPKAPAPIIILASLLQDSAWCYRGGDVAATVAQDSWKPFQDNINAALSVLKKHRATASVDPEYYAQLVSLAIVQDTSREDFEHLLDEASARFPYYYEIYYAAYRYYQPQWHGSMAEIDQFARHVIEKTRVRDGTSGYFRLYFNMALCRCFKDMDAMDWSTMKTSIADLAERYPTDFIYLRIAQLACVRGKREEAVAYLAKVTVNDPVAWTRKDWDSCRALVGPSKAPFPA